MNVWSLVNFEGPVSPAKRVAKKSAGSGLSGFDFIAWHTNEFGNFI